MKNKFITFFCLFALLFFGVLSTAYCSEYRHNHEPDVVNTTQTITTLIGQSEGVSLAIAASQHHYKATTSLQWSVGAGYIDDDSAVSFGLGVQTGKVFVSGNFSSDGSTSAIGVGASGTF